MRFVYSISVRLAPVVIVAASLCLPAQAVDFFAPSARVAPSPASTLAIPAGTPCNGLSNTTGDPDYGNPAGTSGVFIQRFVPTATPFTPMAVCIGGFSGSQAAEPYDVVIYSDVNGAPGPLLAVVSAVPADPGVFPGAWMRTSVSGVPPLDGPFWAGPRITTGVLFSMDFETMPTPAPQVFSVDDGATWIPGMGNDVASIVVEGFAGAAAIPSLSGFGLLSLIAALAVSGSLAIRRA